MCGFAGYMDFRERRPIDRNLLSSMAECLEHRGPDSSGLFLTEGVGMAFRRLSIIDLEHGDQPIYNEDRSIVMVCNGEIFNYRELKNELTAKGHRFKTNTDVEVLVHLYEEHGADLLAKLNGQFAFAIYDSKEHRLFLARDHVGINPLHFTVVDGFILFASEIKAILRHPIVSPKLDLTGLDQILSFPGLVSPRTMFEGISSLPGGHYLTIGTSGITEAQYWDLDYPRIGECPEESEQFYSSRLAEILTRAVETRLIADVPVGFYLSGGMDSSMITALIHRVSPGVRRHSYSIAFDDRQLDESRFQRLMAEAVASEHHEIVFDWSSIADRLRTMVFHCECPVKETFNTCALALSEAVRDSGVKVVLAGEGADELFAGYMGYRFDRMGARTRDSYDVDSVFEDELRQELWGDSKFFYEKDQYLFREIKRALYSDAVNDVFENFDSIRSGLVDKKKLEGRDPVHKRSYLDFKLRLSDHLLSEHGDRMVLANSVEGRYPFLDIELIDFARKIPPHLKLSDFSEKYILKQVAKGLIPESIIRREKFGFRAPGSPYLLNQNVEWINDILSWDRIQAQGYFNPAFVEKLKVNYMERNEINAHLETDLLMLVITFGIFIDLFSVPGFA